MKAVSTNLGDQVQATWTAYKKSIGPLVRISIFSLFLYLVVILGGSIFALIAVALSKTVIVGAAISGAISAVVFVGGLILTGKWSSLAMLTAAKQAVEEKTIDPTKQIFATVKPKIVPAIVLGMISAIIVGMGTLAFIIPGIILGIWFTLSLYILLDGKGEGFIALIKSRDYVKGKTLWLFLRLLFVNTAIPFLINILLSAIFRVFLQMETAQAVSGTLGGLLNLLYAPFQLIFVWVLYEGLKKEKGDIPEPSEERIRKYKTLTALGLVVVMIISGFSAVKLIEFGSTAWKNYQSGKMNEYVNPYQTSPEVQEQMKEYYRMYQDKKVNTTNEHPYTY
jgi:hypothetical protein